MGKEEALVKDRVGLGPRAFDCELDSGDGGYARRSAECRLERVVQKEITLKLEHTSRLYI